MCCQVNTSLAAGLSRVTLAAVPAVCVAASGWLGFSSSVVESMASSQRVPFLKSVTAVSNAELVLYSVAVSRNARNPTPKAHIIP
jgi:hypothetical protein